MAKKSEIKKILAIRNDRFGEFLLNIPALCVLKRTYPQAKLVLAVAPAVKELASLVECVDEVTVWDGIKNSLREQGFDLCVILNPTKEAHLKSFLAGIPLRVGYDRKWGFLLTHKLKDTKSLGNRHEIDCNLELVNLVGAKTVDKTLKIKVDESLFPEFSGKKVIAIHPFTSDAVKLWPVKRFEELALRIRGELNLTVMMIGLSIGKFNLSGDVINMVNKTSLPELAVVLKRCSLLISGDSGPVHLAAAVGTLVIALFRNDLPGKTAKRWGPFGAGHVVIERVDLNDITVDEVFNKVKEALIK